MAPSTHSSKPDPTLQRTDNPGGHVTHSCEPEGKTPSTPTQPLDKVVRDSLAQHKALEKAIEQAENNTAEHYFEELLQMNKDSFKILQSYREVLDQIESFCEEAKADGTFASSTPYTSKE
ncbi:hypothetical protein MPH_08992 [Macrophomina phaseolina MS6]|uniref:Uncharacterized protein n=1 Tax=Macrophomina phaseolina (strain MS6) TaxID=1126212 RepID=K2SAF6_MACPH|nr:hypothetical protein MPH_08992 [Macrophomina phaseolina MS6]